MASSSPILCASFNQDNSCFAVGTKDGFRIFDTNTGKLCYERAVGAFVIVEMLFSSSLLAIVGAGDQPSLSPRRLCLFNTTTGAALRELNFLTSILAIRMNRERLIVILQDKAYVYELNRLTILDTFDTVPNIKVTSRRINFIVDNNETSTTTDGLQSSFEAGNQEKDRSWLMSSLHQIYSRR